MRRNARPLQARGVRADMSDMDLFTWQPKYSIHHAHIDQQHRGLFQAAENLHKAMMRGAGRHAVGDTLRFLLEHSQTHFRDEENLMVSSKFPGYSQHKKEHDSFRTRVIELVNSFTAGEPTITANTMRFVNEWLEGHIMGQDAKIAAHVHATAGKGR
jgi:hemerythrin